MRSETDPQPRERAEVSLRQRCPESGDFATFRYREVLPVAEKPCG